MITKKAFELADRIVWGYNRAGKYSSHINISLLEFLGIEKYQLFCEKINGVNRSSVPKSQIVNFLSTYGENPNDVRSDFEVKTNWTLHQLFITLSTL